MNDESTVHHEAAFRPRARLISILGEHLISDQAVGLVELVKNAYDADATEVEVQILDLGQPETTAVVISDNGSGMTVDDVRTKWLSPAVDHKERDKRENRRTPLGRLPIGEKGVGRFAVHQLGRRLEMITRVAGQPEVVVAIDWDRFDADDAYLDNVPVTISVREPHRFAGDRTGTVMRVGGTRASWAPKLLKKVHRTLRRLQSPLAEEKQRFRVRLRCPEFPEFEAIDPTDILPMAHYEFRALVQETGKCDVEYVCRHPAVAGREVPESDVDLVPLARDDLQSDVPACGPFWLNFYVWDRSKDNLQASGVSRNELDALCGVSLFRDGLRILPYGEPGDDWLLLDQERIQAPADRIGNNQIIGLVQFDQAANLQLRDKTNREGLIENDAFLDLRALVRAAMRQFLKYWRNDRPPARESTRAPKTGTIQGTRTVARALKDTARDDVAVDVPAWVVPGGPGEVSLPAAPGPDGGDEVQVVTQRRALEILLQHIDGTEQSIRDRDRRLDILLQLAGTGLAAERVVHEFGRHVVAASESIGVLRKLASRDEYARAAVGVLDASIETLRSEFRVLAPYEMMGRTERARPVSMHGLARLAIELNSGALSTARAEGTVLGEDWNLRTRPTPVLQMLDNVVHNACTWLVGMPEDAPRRVAVVLVPGMSRVLVVDSGPGIDAEAAPHVFEPFFSMKAGGKGLGLYISSELAVRLGGVLRLAGDEEREDVPDWATGAAFVLEFDPGSRANKNSEGNA
ncbi:MAG: ATP-binding protein [Candidatus Schekmanbacteria bacterium]|nr:ATP-binding protein [Candidatus Schekmanbacteria bacterium]